VSLPGSAVTHTDANAEVGWAYSSVESRVVVEGGAILTHRTPWSYVEERREPDRQLPSIGVLLDHVVQPVCVRVEGELGQDRGQGGGGGGCGVTVGQLPLQAYLIR